MPDSLDFPKKEFEQEMLKVARRRRELRLEAAHAGIRHAIENLKSHVGPLYIGEEAVKVVDQLEAQEASRGK